MIQSFAAELVTLANVFQTGWEALHSDIPVEWPDQQFETPEGTSWLRWSWMPADTVQASMGSPGGRRFRSVGIVDIGVFTIKKQGLAVPTGLADDAAGIYRGYSANGLTCRAPRITISGRAGSVTGASKASTWTDDSPWFQMTVTIPFQRDAIQ